MKPAGAAKRTHPRPSRSPLFWLALALIASLMAGCAAKKIAAPQRTGGSRPYRVGKEWYQPIPDARGFTEKGMASWYGDESSGRTASGELYDPNALTAAHKTLPLGTRVTVTRLDTGDSVSVRINDRGPFVSGRIIDLSRAAAIALNMDRLGTVNVRIEAVAAPAGTSPDDVDVYYEGKFSVQVGSFKNPANADHFLGQIAERYKDAHVMKADVRGETFYRVRIGKFKNLDSAKEFERLIHRRGFPQAVSVAD